MSAFDVWAELWNKDCKIWFWLPKYKAINRAIGINFGNFPLLLFFRWAFRRGVKMKGAFLFYPPWGFHHFFATTTRQFHVFSAPCACQETDITCTCHHLDSQNWIICPSSYSSIQRDFVTSMLISNPCWGFSRQENMQSSSALFFFYGIKFSPSSF